MITYSEEDPASATWADNSLLVFGNLFGNTNHSAIAVNNSSTAVTAFISCNAFDNIPTISQGAATLTGNVTSGRVPACGQFLPEPPGYLAWLAGLLSLATIRRFGWRPRLAE